jgi:hypothetical protein
MYKLFKNLTGETIVFNQETNTSFPCSEANIDYQAYLAWIAEGNTPIPAEEAQ